jgi:hypothetical protein
VPTFVAKAKTSTIAAGTTLVIADPATVTDDNLALLFYWFNGTGQTHTIADNGVGTRPWDTIVQVESVAKSITLVIFSKVLVAADASTSITVSSSNPNNKTRIGHLVVYDDAEISDFRTVFESIVGTTHTCPVVAANKNSDWVVNSVCDRNNPGSTAINGPGNITSREESYQSGPSLAYLGAITGDDDSVGVGLIGDNIFTSDISIDKACMATVILTSPASAHSEIPDDAMGITDAVDIQYSPAWIWDRTIRMG